MMSTLAAVRNNIAEASDLLADNVFLLSPRLQRTMPDLYELCCRVLEGLGARVVVDGKNGALLMSEDVRKVEDMRMSLEQCRPRVTHVLAVYGTEPICIACTKLVEGGGRPIDLVTVQWIVDVCVEKAIIKLKNGHANSALHSPLKFETPVVGFSGALISLSNYEGLDRSRLKNMIHSIGATYTGHLTSQHNLLISKYKSGLKYENAVVWKVPVVNEMWLIDTLNSWVLMPFASERYRPAEPPATNTATTTTTTTTIIPIAITSSSSSSSSSTTSMPLPVPAPSPRKRRPRVAFTCIRQQDRALFARQVEKMGGLVVSANECSHLVSSKISRTEKFLIGLCIADYIVDPKWIVDSNASGAFLDPLSYHLIDPAMERQLQFSLSALMRKVKTQPAPLFAGKEFVITPSVQPSPTSLENIVNAAGGIVVKVEDVESLKPEMEDVFIISCISDAALLPRFIERGHVIYNAGERASLLYIYFFKKYMYIYLFVTATIVLKEFVCKCTLLTFSSCAHTEIIIGSVLHQEINRKAHLLDYSSVK